MRSDGTIGSYTSRDVPAIYRIEQNLHEIPPENWNQLRYQLEQMACDPIQNGPGLSGNNPFTNVEGMPRGPKPAPLGDYVPNNPYSSLGSGKVDCATCGRRVWRWDFVGSHSGEL